MKISETERSDERETERSMKERQGVSANELTRERREQERLRATESDEKRASREEGESKRE